MPCGRGESNPHARGHQILSLAWLPLHHSRANASLGTAARPGASQGSPGWGKAGSSPPDNAWQASGVARDPKQIQAEIDQARYSLAATLDQIAYRTNPKKLSGDAQTAVKAWLASPKGRIAIGVVGSLVALRLTVGVVRKIRNH